MKSKLVAIVIPRYQNVLSASEEASLSLAKKTFKDYDLYFVSPESLNLKTNTPTVRFSDKYFKDVKSYSQLLLKSEFYEAFKAYDFILIYQLDALVLNDQLANWYQKGFDYIGAPWWRSFIGYLTSARGGFRHVGNGGLSLRKVKSHLAVLAETQKQATVTDSTPQRTILSFLLALLQGKSRQKWMNFPAELYPFNEDGFWSFEAQKYAPDFKIPNFEVANLFAIETHVRASLSLNKGRLPFGVHAWEKYDKEFWLTAIKKSH